MAELTTDDGSAASKEAVEDFERASAQRRLTQLQNELAAEVERLRGAALIEARCAREFDQAPHRLRLEVNYAFIETQKLIEQADRLEEILKRAKGESE